MARRKFNQKSTGAARITRKDNPLFWKKILGEAGKKARLDFGLVGDTGKEQYPNGLTLAENAAIQSFGTSTIPARPFLELDPAIVKAQLKWVSEQVFSGKGSRAQALEYLGKWALAKVRAKIDAHIPPRNAPRTIAKKGFDHPLIETHKLYDALDYEVVRGK